MMMSYHWWNLHNLIGRHLYGTFIEITPNIEFNEEFGLDPENVLNQGTLTPRGARYIDPPALKIIEATTEWYVEYLASGGGVVIGANGGIAVAGGAPKVTIRPFTKLMIERNIQKTGITVLGPHRRNSIRCYTQVAESRKASYFDIGEHWKDLTNPERAVANMHFLDIVTASGDTIELTIPKNFIDRNSWLWWEIDYLTTRKNYVWQGDRTLIPSN